MASTLFISGPEWGYKNAMLADARIFPPPPHRTRGRGYFLKWSGPWPVSFPYQDSESDWLRKCGVTCSCCVYIGLIPSKGLLSDRLSGIWEWIRIGKGKGRMCEDNGEDLRRLNWWKKAQEKGNQSKQQEISHDMEREKCNLFDCGIGHANKPFFSLLSSLLHFYSSRSFVTF